MLLRRVIQHFRKQEWTAIGIDFLIVIVGVYIGIQAANWNEQRADEVRSREYLLRIQSDLKSDLARYQDRLRFWGQVADYGDAGLRFADTGRNGSKDSWALVLAFFQASQIAEFITTDATFEELKSAGELNLIDSVELRDQLADYYTNADNAALSERPAYREHVRAIIPLEMQKYIWSKCYGSTITGSQEMLDCTSPVSEAEAAAVAQRISRDEMLMGELRYWMSTMQVASLMGRDRIDYAQKIIAAIDGELER